MPAKLPGLGTQLLLSFFGSCAEAAVQAVWLGHATVLVQLDGLTLLTDPIFSERCSPVQFLGPRCVLPNTFAYSPACCLCSTLRYLARRSLVRKRQKGNRQESNQAELLESSHHILQSGVSLLIPRTCG